MWRHQARFTEWWSAHSMCINLVHLTAVLILQYAPRGTMLARGRAACMPFGFESRSPLSIFKPLARTRLYHSVHQEHNRKINFSEQMSPGKRRGSREDVFSGRGSKEGRQGPTNSRGSGEDPNVDGDPEKTPKKRGSRKGLRGIQGRPSTMA